MFSAISSIPALTPESTAALIQLPLADPGKRPWETTKSAYFAWATQQLLAKVKPQILGAGDTTVASLGRLTDTIAKSRDMNALMETSAELPSRPGYGAEGD